jgi:hypothetical protein
MWEKIRSVRKPEESSENPHRQKENPHRWREKSNRQTESPPHLHPLRRQFSGSLCRLWVNITGFLY